MNGSVSLRVLFNVTVTSKCWNGWNFRLSRWLEDEPGQSIKNQLSVQLLATGKKDAP